MSTRDGDWGVLKEPTLPVPDKPTSSTPNVEPGSLGDDETLSAYSDHWQLPGYGESGDDCQNWRVEAVCDTCGHVDLSQHQCGRRTCPNCWQLWADAAAIRATVRLQLFRYTREFKQAAHAVVSPSDGDIRSEREFYDGKKKASEIAQEKGWRGFAIIAHPYRITDEAEAEYKAEVERDADGNPEVGVWVWLRQTFGEAELHDRIYWSPHYHIVGATSRGMDPADEDDEWVYNFIGSLPEIRGSWDGQSHVGVYGCFRYLLSHTGWPDGSSKQTITWYGDLANSVFVEDATQGWQIQQPSEGVKSTIQRNLEEEIETDAEVDADGESDDLSEESDDCGPCPDSECDGRLIDVWDIRQYLEHNDPPPDVADRMRTAREWRAGERRPPPGLKHPQTETQAREALDAMCK